MSDVDFGGLVCISFVVIVLFHVGFSTPNWIKMQEVTSANSTNNSTLSLTTRTCHHGLFYSYDCPESENGILFFKKTSRWYLYDYLVIMIFDVYWCFKHLFDLRIFIIWKAQCCLFFSFTIWSETKCKIYFNFYPNYLHSLADCKKKGGFLLGHTLKPCVPWSHLTGLAPNCPSLTFGPKFGHASNIDLLSNLVVSNLVTS